MYEGAEAEIKRILQLVEVCPEPFREKAFEILLQGYVSSIVRPAVTEMKSQLRDQGALPPDSPGDHSWREAVPEEVLPRFQTMATRIKVSPEKLADLFDFSADPFEYAAVHVEGKSNRERVLRVAMLVAARSYLATGRWFGDWAEVKAMCTHQSCYDVNNFAATLTRAEGDWFRKVNSGTGIQLSAKGQKEAERLLAVLAGGSDASEQ